MMQETNFYFQDGALMVEQLPVATLVKEYGTPLYIYSQAAIESRWESYEQALADCRHWLCFAVKANSNIGLLHLLAKKNAGFDIVSGGELARCLAAKANPKKIIFSGVGKQDWEIEHALDAGIGCFNVESSSELEQITRIAQSRQQRAPIAFRVNPDVDPKTHPYISTGLQENKFGIAWNEALALYEQAHQNAYCHVIGIACHIGSQITTIEPFIDALNRLLTLVDQLAEKGIHLQHISIGGGLGISYHQEHPPTPAALCEALKKTLGNRPLILTLEPGRSIVGDAGILVSKVIHIKQQGQKQFAIIDAGMNDLLRPALYHAWHDIVNIQTTTEPAAVFDIVGPVCESSDIFAAGRELALRVDDHVALLQTGAYGFSMSSTYNSRAQPAEVLVNKDTAHLIRARASIADLFKDEFLPDA